MNADREVRSTRCAAARLLGGAVLAALLCAAGEARAAYTLIDLGGVPAGAGAIAISSDGAVAGYQMSGPYMPHATLFENGRLIDLGTLGGDASFANGAASGDRVVGWARLPDETRHAFLYDGGIMHDLGTLGGVTSQAFAMNDAGVVVGSSYPEGSDVEVPMIWTAAGGMRALPVPQVNGGQALCINRSGQIVGYFIDEVMVQPFLYADGHATQLPTLGGWASKAYGISDNGYIVGYALTNDPNFPKFHAVMWSDEGIFDYGALAGGHGVAYAVNDAGVAVGFSYTAELDMVATRYAEGRIHDLNEELPAGSPWHLSLASGITADGVISGTGVVDGATRAYALVPDGAVGERWGLPSHAALRSYPQPMRDAGTLELVLAGTVTGKVWLYDLAGRRVAELGGGTFARGTVTIPVPSGVLSRLQSGVYYARWEGGGEPATRRVVVVR
jgi:probable HAF family extracellular repeat protein